jgi:hypothetical protein
MERETIFRIKRIKYLLEKRKITEIAWFFISIDYIVSLYKKDFNLKIVFMHSMK